MTTQPGETITPGMVKLIEEGGMPQWKNPFTLGGLYIKFEVEFPTGEDLSPQIVEVNIKKKTFLFLTREDSQKCLTQARPHHFNPR